MEINSKRIKFQIRKNHFIRNDRIIIYYKYIIWILIMININRKKYMIISIEKDMMDEKFSFISTLIKII